MQSNPANQFIFLPKNWNVKLIYFQFNQNLFVRSFAVQQPSTPSGQIIEISAPVVSVVAAAAVVVAAAAAVGEVVVTAYAVGVVVISPQKTINYWFAPFFVTISRFCL